MRVKLVGILLILLLFTGSVLAQGGTLNYGDTTVGTLSSQAPLAFFTFNGNAGDRVTINAIGITPEFDPAISLNSPTQQQLANNDNDPTSPGTTDARVTLTLEQTGVHTILVSSVSGAPGDFLIRLFGQPATSATDISASRVQSTVTSGQPAQVFSFNADPAGPVTVNINTTTPEFAFSASVFDSNGQPVAILSGNNLAGASLNLPPGNGVYTVEIIAVTRDAAGEVGVWTSTQTTAPQQPDVPPPAQTEEAAPAFADDVCNVASQGDTSTNVRSGPSTSFDIITSLDPGERLEVTGVYNTWYRVNVPGVGEGWVRRDVVTSFGPCDVIPVLDQSQVPQAPQQVAPPAETEEVNAQQTGPTATASATTQGQQQITQATPTPTATQAQQQATATYTPSYTPTTPPAAQVAPDDSNYSLTIALDSTASLTDFVSYPGGDREDRVSWNITGMNPNVALPGGRAQLVIAVSCFGQNTNQVQFFTGGQTYSCGQTIVDREVTNDSRTGSVTITAVGGEGTYVQWVLTGTATRVN